MKQLGYYAKDFRNNLFKFEWGDNDKFYIIDINGKRLANPKDYEILEIGFFTADN